MQQFKLDSSPDVYYISRNNCSKWVLFLYAAFANHEMFQSQIEYFENKYPLLICCGKFDIPMEFEAVEN
ncbi:MAG: hypothetical protein OSJ61_07440 [Lachnospiraceae bacterium]|nr:hypothetical protein [Lachnospiraceae bacterium]